VLGPRLIDSDFQSMQRETRVQMVFKTRRVWVVCDGSDYRCVSFNVLDLVS